MPNSGWWGQAQYHDNDSDPASVAELDVGDDSSSSSDQLDWGSRTNTDEFYASESFTLTVPDSSSRVAFSVNSTTVTQSTSNVTVKSIWLYVAAPGGAKCSLNNVSAVFTKSSGGTEQPSAVSISINRRAQTQPGSDDATITPPTLPGSDYYSGVTVTGTVAFEIDDGVEPANGELVALVNPERS